jgi:rubrerythrin
MVEEYLGKTMPRYKCLKCGKLWEEWIRPVKNCPFCRNMKIEKANEFGELLNRKGGKHDLV